MPVPRRGSAPLLRSALGDSQVLARPEQGRLWVLNGSAASIWDLHAEGLAPAAIARSIAEHFNVDEQAIQATVDGLIRGWRDAGLTEESSSSVAAVAWPAENAPWVIPPASANSPARVDAPEEASPEASVPAPWRAIVNVGGSALAIAVDNPTLAALATTAIPLLDPPRPPGDNRSAQHPPIPECERAIHHLHLSGGTQGWRLGVDGEARKSGQDADTAIVEILHTMIDLACRSEDRLLVVHGAGLVAPDGRGLLLIAPGGSGKTTLATALNAEGFGLLSDDVVPVRRDGTLVALGTPICLKPGSWPVLASRRPDLGVVRTMNRQGQLVRYLPPRGPPPGCPVLPGWLLFPRHRPGGVPAIEPLSPETALQGIVEAEAVIRNLDQAKLDDLVGWVAHLPAYRLSYPDLDHALALTRTALAWRRRAGRHHRG